MDCNQIELCERQDCTGCFACEAVCPKTAIRKVKSDEGFEYPEIERNLCVSCHACQQVCPVLTPVAKYLDGEIYASWNKNEEVRSESSSGGMFSVFAEQILADNGMVVGAAMSEDNFVRHVVVCKQEDLQSLRGSKYVQSLMGRELYASIRTTLREGKKILFCGTPCQVAAIRNVFKRYRGQLFLLDLVCHGVPSPEFFAIFLSKLKKKIPNLVSYQFRDLKHWSVCANININVNGIIHNRVLYGEPTFYQDAFLKGYLHRENCYHCKYATSQRVGDITLADFWGIGKYQPIADDYKEGCSMVSINSTQGHELLRLVSKYIFLERRNIQETISGGNEQLIKPSFRPKERDTFYKDAFAISYKKLIAKYNLNIKKQVSFSQRLKIKIKELVKYLNNV